MNALASIGGKSDPQILQIVFVPVVRPSFPLPQF
jgi:hypothetical protein